MLEVHVTHQVAWSHRLEDWVCVLVSLFGSCCSMYFGKHWFCIPKELIGNSIILIPIFYISPSHIHR